MTATRLAAPRDPAIDCLKGALILAVIGIHAGVLRGAWVMTHLLNHAVPVFVVLLGLNAEQWWRRRGEPGAAAWYGDRARRLYPPLWAALALWWAVALVAAPWWLHPTWWLVALNIAGVLPNIGLDWFVTLLLQLVLLQPLLHRLANRFGMAALATLGLACLVGAVVARPWLVAWLGLWGARAFAPRLLGHVTFGMLLARRPILAPRAGVVAGALAAACVVAQEAAAPDVMAGVLERLVDLPLSAALLVAFRPVAGWSALARPLRWLGLHSYGLYLAHALVHDTTLMALGPRGPFERFGSWPYAVLLLAGALVLVFAGNVLRRQLTRAFVARA